MSNTSENKAFDQESKTNMADKSNDNIAIEVKDVSMTFNMASEQLNSLKEYFISLAKGKLYFEEFNALNDISFTVNKGDVFGIVGTNGSGKSTMLKIIAGVLEPSKGSATINGNIAPLIELGAGFDMELSARENIYLNGSLLGYSKEFIKQHFNEIVSFAEIEQFLDMPMKNYSSGMVARIAFAIATVIVPEILIVDEVLSVGDFMFQQKCEDKINSLIKQGVTVLIVSHSIHQIARLCNRCIWIEKGHTKMLGDAKTICDAYISVGGRKGSKEAENYIFKAIKNQQDLNADIQAICTANYSQTSVRLNTKVIEKLNTDTLIVIPGLTHIDSVAASFIAGHYNCPVLAVHINNIDDYSREFILKYKPTRIFFIDIAHNSNELLDKLKSLTNYDNVKYFVFNNDQDPIAHSKDLLEFGSKNSIMSNCICLIDFCETFTAYALSSYLFANKIPCYIVPVEFEANKKDILNVISKYEFKKVILAGSKLNNEIETAIIEKGIETIKFNDTDASLNTFNASKFVLENLSSDKQKNLCFALQINSIWQELLACAPFLHHTNSSLILQDMRSLDNIYELVKLTEKHCNAKSQTFLLGAPDNATDPGFNIIAKNLKNIN